MLVYDQPQLVAAWVALQLGWKDPAAFEPCYAIGVVRGDKPIAGFVYNNYHTDINGLPHSIELSVASTDPRWMTRQTVRAMFAYPFTHLGVKRLQAQTSVSDAGVNSIMQRLGFTREGLLRCARIEGGDAYAWGMLTNECTWIGNG